jgi:hypothetical protein
VHAGKNLGEFVSLVSSRTAEELVAQIFGLEH